MVAVGIRLPTLVEHPEGSLGVFDRLKVRSGVRSVVENYTSNDTTIEAADVFGPDTMEQILDVLVRVGDVQLGEVMTKHVGAFNYGPSGRAGLV